DLLALRGGSCGVGETPKVKGERPFVRLRQAAEALHRRALKPLVDDLVISEQAALPRPVMVGERYGMRVERGGGGRLRVARSAVAGGAILGVKRRAPRRIGQAARREGHRVS